MVVNKWQPIETAPMGEMILFADMNAKEARFWAHAGWRYSGVGDYDDVQSPHGFLMKATHWMPLPEPPSE